MKAGAKDVGGDIDALHRVLIRSGDRTGRRLLNNCPYTSTFRRKTLEDERAKGGPKTPRSGPLHGNGRRGPGKDARHKRRSEGRGHGARTDSSGELSKTSQELPSTPAQCTPRAGEPGDNAAATPKTPSRRRIAAQGVASLKALLHHNAKALEGPPGSGNARMQRGRGRFQAAGAPKKGEAAGFSDAPSARHVRTWMLAATASVPAPIDSGLTGRVLCSGRREMLLPQSPRRQQRLAPCS